MNIKSIVAVLVCFVSFSAISQQLNRMLLENWKDGAWENRMQQLPFYDEEGRLKKQEIAHWNAELGVWEDQTKTEFNRDENGILLTRETYKWSQDESKWNGTIRASYTINEINKPSSVLTEVQDESGWYNQSIDEYAYDANGNLVERIRQRWDKHAISWILDRKFTYEIESDRTAGYTICFWDNQLGEWEPYKKSDYQYTQDKTLDQIIFDTWIDGEWKQHSVRKNIRDEKGVINSMEVDLFEEKTTLIQKYSHVDYQMTDFGKISESISKKWKSELANWENLQRSTYYYSKDGEMLEDFTEPNKTLEIFPNPAVESLTIHSLPKGTMTILDAMGKIVFEGVNNEEEIQLDVSKWEIGVYTVQVNGKDIEKFVKQ